jgi:hypothetical protein
MFGVELLDISEKLYKLEELHKTYMHKDKRVLPSQEIVVSLDSYDRRELFKKQELAHGTLFKEKYVRVQAIQDAFIPSEYYSLR